MNGRNYTPKGMGPLQMLAYEANNEGTSSQYKNGRNMNMWKVYKDGWETEKAFEVRSGTL